MGIVFCNLEAKERDFGIFIWHRFVYVMACGYRESTGFFTASRMIPDHAFVCNLVYTWNHVSSARASLV
jgi:hypothetical protein